MFPSGYYMIIEKSKPGLLPKICCCLQQYSPELKPRLFESDLLIRIVLLLEIFL